MDEIANPESQTARPLAVNDAVNTVQTTMDNFLSAANVDAVYGTPIREGGNIIIPAAEVLSIAGFGLGSGSGPSGPEEKERPGGGGGGGGGGHVLSRPVAAIVISPAGVRVEPIVDVTKIALAGLTTLGFMAAMLSRMRNVKPPKF
jgi:uncharacterized spore protein YtfJ